MASTRQNIQVALKNPRARVGIIICAIVVALMVAYAMFQIRTPTPATGGASGARLPPPPVTDPVPGRSNNADYTILVQQDNERKRQEAIKLGQGHVPTIVGNPESNYTIPVGAVPPPPPASFPAPVTPPVTTQQPPARQDPPVRQAAPQVSAAQRDAYKKAEKQVLGYMALWEPRAGMQEFAYVGEEAEPASVPAGGTQAAPNNRPGVPSQGQVAVSGASGQGTRADGSSLMVRAGTVVPSILVTPINSDAPGPVVADIVSGPLAGARVLGSYQANDQQLVVRFDKLSMPGHPQTYAIDAFAVGTDMSSGLATDVNNHYFRRFGLTAAAAFIQGYGRAVGRQNTTVTNGPFGSVVTQGELDSGQIKSAALGDVGTALGQQIAREANIKPTIRAEGQDGRGLPIGLLFMNDF